MSSLMMLLEVRGNTLKYVVEADLSRKAMACFPLDLNYKGLYGCRCIDRRFYRLYAYEWCSQKFFLLMSVMVSLLGS